MPAAGAPWPAAPPPVWLPGTRHRMPDPSSSDAGFVPRSPPRGLLPQPSDDRAKPGSPPAACDCFWLRDLPSVLFTFRHGFTTLSNIYGGLWKGDKPRQMHGIYLTSLRHFFNNYTLIQ